MCPKFLLGGHQRNGRWGTHVSWQCVAIVAKFIEIAICSAEYNIIGRKYSIGCNHIDNEFNIVVGEINLCCVVIKIALSREK